MNNSNIIPVIGSGVLFKQFGEYFCESDQYLFVHISNPESIYGLSGRRLNGAVFLRDWWHSYTRSQIDQIEDRIHYRVVVKGSTVTKKAIVLGTQQEYKGLKDIIYRCHGFRFINAHDAISMHDIVTAQVVKNHSIIFYAYLRACPEYKSRFTERTLNLLTDRP